MKTRIILSGAKLENVQSLLSNNVVVQVEDKVVINPLSENSVYLDTWNDEVLIALAHMSDFEYGQENEYFVKLGGDSKNFTAQRLYKAIRPINETQSLIDNRGLPNSIKGVETGEPLFRKATTEEIIDKLSKSVISVTFYGDAEVIRTFAKVNNLKLESDDLYGLVELQGNYLVKTDKEGTYHTQLLTDWAKATELVRDLRPKLPTINGYNGEVLNDFVVYGCAKLPIAWFKAYEGTNRRIKSIELTSEVTITADDFEKIAIFLK